MESSSFPGGSAVTPHSQSVRSMTLPGVNSGRSPAFPRLLEEAVRSHSIILTMNLLCVSIHLIVAEASSAVQVVHVLNEYKGKDVAKQPLLALGLAIFCHGKVIKNSRRRTGSLNNKIQKH